VLENAVVAVLNASRVCREVQRRLVEGASLQKGDKSPVTVADFASQAVVSHMLGSEIPLVGEEDAQLLRENPDMAAKVVACAQSVLPDITHDEVLDAIDRGTYAGGANGRFWVLDPIDGTKGFLRMDQYAVALGLVEDGVPVVGVLGCPNLDGGRVFIAQKGKGCMQRSLDSDVLTPVTVDDIAEVGAARFCESVESGHSRHDHSARIAEKLGITAEPYRIDSQCKYAAVARGDASIYLRLPTRKDYVERIWDHAAGWMVVTEAGGTVTDVTGKPLDFSLGRGLEANKGVVVTNGAFHDEVISAVRAVLEI
jgi:3'(2'), 5'-bisphosphate nucleotidase